MDAHIIKEVAWIGEAYVKGAIKGVVLSFHGLGGGVKNGPGMEELEWAKNGALIVHPYYGPWAWMNRNSRAMVDELLDAVYAAHGLPDRTPLAVWADRLACSTVDMPSAV